MKDLPLKDASGCTSGQAFRIGFGIKIEKNVVLNLCFRILETVNAN